MKLLLLSDMHGDTTHLDLLTKEFDKVDAVLFAGDFACFKKPETAGAALEALLKKTDTVLAVTGNCDNSDFIEELEKYDINVQGTMVFQDGLFFAGSGGALKFTGITPNERTDEDLISDLQFVKNQSEGQIPENLVIIAHNPPHNTKLDVVAAGFHVGSPALRTFIEKNQPLLCLSGHIHESAAIDSIGKTTLINPGSFAEGKYAYAEIQKKNGEWQVVSAALHELGGL